jgi:hypothetical protein
LYEEGMLAVKIAKPLNHDRASIFSLLKKTIILPKSIVPNSKTRSRGPKIMSKYLLDVMKR